MSILVGPEAERRSRLSPAWTANIEALGKIDPSLAEQLAETDPQAPQAPPAELPALPTEGNLLIDVGAEYRRLADVLDRLDIQQIVYVLEPDLPSLAAGLA